MSSMLNLPADPPQAAAPITPAAALRQAGRSRRAMSGHQRPNRGASDTWLTPPNIIDALGPFDLDPCCPVGMPWPTATTMLTPEDDGLAQLWRGTVWCNPPFGPEAGRWLAKLANHGNGIALVNARTETRWFHAHVWKRASALRFFAGRLHFHRIDGVRAKLNAGAPSVLVAYGDECAERLARCALAGAFVRPAAPSQPLPRSHAAESEVRNA